MKTEKKPTDMLLLDGSGALYFVARQPQATKMTRQEMRESSQSGVVHMDRMLGRSFTPKFLGLCIFAFGWLMVIINMMLPPGW